MSKPELEFFPVSNAAWRPVGFQNVVHVCDQR